MGIDRGLERYPCGYLVTYLLLLECFYGWKALAVMSRLAQGMCWLISALWSAWVFIMANTILGFVIVKSLVSLDCLR